MDIKKLNEKLKMLLEDTATLEAPVEQEQPKEEKKDRRSFIYYIKAKAKNNQIDWDNAYRDPDDGYKWYLPLKYWHNAERVARAIKDNFRRGKLDVNVKILPEPEDIDEPRYVELNFRNKKKEREDSTYTWVKEAFEDDEYPPTSFEFDVQVESLEELNDDEFIFELLTDLISDEYGYCHYGFNAEVIERDKENLIAKCKVSNVEWDLSDDWSEDDEDNSVDALLAFSDHEELIDSEEEFEDYLCHKKGKGYCVTSITYEYEKPQINFQTDWFETKEEAIDNYKREFLGESLDEAKDFFGDEYIAVTYKMKDVANFVIVSWEPGDWVARANHVAGKFIEAYGATKEELIEDIKKKMQEYELEVVEVE